MPKAARIGLLATGCAMAQGIVQDGAGRTLFVTMGDLGSTRFHFAPAITYAAFSWNDDAGS